MTSPQPTDLLVSDLRFQVITDEPGARARAHVGEHVADRIAASLILTDPGATAQAGHALVQACAALADAAVAVDHGRPIPPCPHVGAIVDVLGYAGLHLIDRAQQATR